MCKNSAYNCTFVLYFVELCTYMFKPDKYSVKVMVHFIWLPVSVTVESQSDQGKQQTKLHVKWIQLDNMT